MVWPLRCLLLGHVVSSINMWYAWDPLPVGSFLSVLSPASGPPSVTLPLDVHALLGDVALENEDFQSAASDYGAALKLFSELEVGTACLWDWVWWVGERGDFHGLDTSPSMRQWHVPCSARTRSCCRAAQCSHRALLH